jgi:hypothetical protein
MIFGSPWSTPSLLSCGARGHPPSLPVAVQTVPLDDPACPDLVLLSPSLVGAPGHPFLTRSCTDCSPWTTLLALAWLSCPPLYWAPLVTPFLTRSCIQTAPLDDPAGPGWAFLSPSRAAALVTPYLTRSCSDCSPWTTLLALA